jgi:DNA-binding GntR family transcriptional regulator
VLATLSPQRPLPYSFCQSSPEVVVEMLADKRETLSDIAYRRIADLLMAGRFAPGEKLPLRSTASAMRVSMMPVREAVARLVTVNALEVIPNSAVRVPVMSRSQFRDLTRVRVAIEGFAAAEAARLRTESDLLRIKETEVAFYDEARLSVDLAQAVERNKNFHFAVYEAAQSPVLLEIIRTLWLKAGPAINLDLRADPDRIRNTHGFACHAEAVAALRAGDPRKAKRAIARDIETTAAYLLERGLD